MDKIKAGPTKKNRIHKLPKKEKKKKAITTHIPEILKAIRESYELYYANILNNLFEMDNS